LKRFQKCFRKNNENNKFKGASVASIKVVGPFKVIVKIITTPLNCCKQSSHALVMIQKYSFLTLIPQRQIFLIHKIVLIH
jgi:hypothetical protein